MTIDNQTIMAEVLMGSLPNTVRNTLLRDGKFCEQISYEPQFVFPLGTTRALADSLYNNLRAAVSGRKTGTLALADKTKQKVKLGFQKPSTATMLLEKQGFSFSDADLLSGSKKTRLAGLARAFSTRPLLPEEQDAWRSAVDDALSDRQFVLLMTALGATPEGFSDSARKLNRLRPDNLVPDEPDYFRRLLAPDGAAKGLAEFIAGDLSVQRRALLAQNKKLALRRIAYSGLARDLVPSELLKDAKPAELHDLLAANDPFSLLTVFELAADRVESDKRFGGVGEKALQKLFTDKKADARAELFSAFAVITIVKMRTLFSELQAPLYWFRLAAFAHAGVLTDSLITLSKPKGFLEWVRNEMGANYLWFSNIDRRDAPRWDPEWLSPDQIRSELLGRVLNAMRGKKCPKSWETIAKRAASKLGNGRELTPFFAGPMDDFTVPIEQTKRNQQLVKIEQKLKKTKSLDKMPSVAALVYLERPSKKIAEDVQRLLQARRKQGRVLSEDQANHLMLYAHLASSARSEALANEIINCSIWCARGRNLEPGDVSLLFGASIVACAAVADRAKYGALIADAATRMAYSVLEDKRCTQQLRFMCEALGRRDPQLIPRLSQAVLVADAELLRQ